ncbi:synphilin-1 [Electrophorus electricus]|uniref:Synphilin-1 alpha-Synuclein-binding domain-containing protein n=1 Tax=Electrophorus electricus TaxID=8005 RepID=A0A4W4EUI3_ELEEL|nr:synphilin-1 [Electrophorus electricus]
MEAPEYLDLDEIDFTDDLAYTSKSIPELCRRNDGQAEERQAPGINWGRSASLHSGSGIKPTGIADVYSKFRPVKRVSPLKHQPEVLDTETDNKSPGQSVEGNKEEPSSKGLQTSMTPGDIQGLKCKSIANGALLGELEHYDLDMDEILDVPYIKSNQQMATLPRVTSEKRPSGSSAGDRCLGVHASSHTHAESVGGGTQFCVLSPINWPDMRKSKSMDPDYLRTVGYDHSPSSLHCSISEADKLLSSRSFPDTPTHKAGTDNLGSQPLFPIQGGAVGRLDSAKSWSSSRAFGECDEETKKSPNIINIVREGQISLLPHFATESLELIRDEDGNNLLHISAAQGHAECLQHLTSLMGEDCLNERNKQQLTPAGLGVRNGQLECVRWMVSETEAIAELSCTRDHPSLIHYAARYGQERILLWLLQFMQEQAISLDEVDQNGNSAVHVAAQYGHLGCLQTLVEYGSNVTVQNQQGERPSQCAERQGHTTCSRYLVVVETCMSLASQVVKLTKQLHEQSTARLALQNQVQMLLQCQDPNGRPRSPSSLIASVEAWPEMTLTAEVAPGDGQWVLRQRNVDSDAVLRRLLGKDIAERVSSKEKLTMEFQEGAVDNASGIDVGMGPGAGPPRRLGVVEKRELKLARLKQIMQRSLSESDTDAYPPDEHKQASGVSRPERPTQLPIAENEESVSGLHLLMKKHASAAERKFSFALRTSKSMDGYNPSPTSDNSDLDHETKTELVGEFAEFNSGQKVTSPKSALKSPSSRRKTSQSLKLRVTFDEAPVVHKDGQAGEVKGASSKEKTSESGKRPFGTFRSIMETLSGNQNSNNNNGQSTSPGKHSASSSAQGLAGKKNDAKASPGGLSKCKNKTSAV